MPASSVVTVALRNDGPARRPVTAVLHVHRRVDPWWPFRLWAQVRDGPEVALHGGRSHVLEVADGVCELSASLAGWAAVPVTVALVDGDVRHVRVAVRSSWILTQRSKHRP